MALMRLRALTLVLMAASMFVGVASAQAADATRPVLWVGNNWDGTADAVDPVGFQKLAHLNIVPDKDERLAEIQLDPARQGYFFAIREAGGGGPEPLRG